MPTKKISKNSETKYKIIPTIQNISPYKNFKITKIPKLENRGKRKNKNNKNKMIVESTKSFFISSKQ